MKFLILIIIASVIVTASMYFEALLGIDFSEVSINAFIIRRVIWFICGAVIMRITDQLYPKKQQ